MPLKIKQDEVEATLRTALQAGYRLNKDELNPILTLMLRNKLQH